MVRDERKQLMIARKLWARPHVRTVARVREEIDREKLRSRNQAPGYLSRDQIEVLEILVEMTERCFEP